VESNGQKLLSGADQEAAEGGAADAVCLLQDRFEDRLRVARRAVDDFQDLGERPLLSALGFELLGKRLEPRFEIGGGRAAAYRRPPPVRFAPGGGARHQKGLPPLVRFIDESIAPSALLDVLWADRAVIFFPIRGRKRNRAAPRIASERLKEVHHGEGLFHGPLGGVKRRRPGSFRSLVRNRSSAVGGQGY
jgi:hypothetical protein